MQKLSVIVGITAFILITIIVLSADNSSQIKKVQFTNQNLKINHEDTDIANNDVEINLNKTTINNKEIKTNNKNLDIKNKNLKLNNTDTKLQNTGYSNQNIDYDGQKFNLDNHNTSHQNSAFENQNSNLNRQGTNYSKQNVDFGNQNNRYQNSSFTNQNSKLNKQLANYEQQKANLQNIKNNLKNQKNKTSSLPPKERQRKYLVKNIDWNVWKSNFVNQILDDSVYIKELDEYGVGTWFYYSFTVNSAGGIYNIQVTSPYLLKEDKDKIVQMIKDYEYQDITIFPSNSKRQTANVNAIVLLGETEKKTKPSDFNDFEKVKIKMP